MVRTFHTAYLMTAECMMTQITYGSWRLCVVQADSRKDYLGGHQHLPVEAHLGSKELRPEVLAMDCQT